MSKFLDEQGLSHLWSKIKSLLQTSLSSITNHAKLTDTNSKNKALVSTGSGYQWDDVPVINAVAETYNSTAAVTSSPYKASIWRVDLSDKIDELYSGLTILIKVPVAGNGTYGTLLRIDGINSDTDSNTNLYPVCANVNTMVSTRYAVGCIIALTFDATQAGQTLYYNSASAYTTTANGTGWTKPGCWKIADYSTGDTTTGREGYYYLRPYAGQAVYRYKFLMEGADGRLYPIVTTNQTSATQVTKTPTTVGLRPWKIWYYNHTDTVSAGGAFEAQRVYPELYTTTATYNFNAATGTYAWIFLQGSYDKNTDLFTLDTGNNYYKFVRYNAAINWASSLTVGKYYILLGSSYSTTNYVQLFNVNPFYYFDGTNLIPVTTKIAKDSAPIQSISVNGTTQTITNGNVDLTISGSSLPNNYAPATGSNEDLVLEGGDTYDEAFSKIDKAIQDNEYVISTALNDLNLRVNTNTQNINTKQDILVSGTDIKTINNESLLGSGNITISAGTTLSSGRGITIDSNNALNINEGSTLPTGGYDLSAVTVDSNIVKTPLPYASSSRKGIIQPGSGLLTSNGVLNVNYGNGLGLNQNLGLEVALGDGLSFNNNGEIVIVGFTNSEIDAIFSSSYQTYSE